MDILVIIAVISFIIKIIGKSNQQKKNDTKRIVTREEYERKARMEGRHDPRTDMQMPPPVPEAKQIKTSSFESEIKNAFDELKKVYSDMQDGGNVKKKYTPPTHKPIKKHAEMQMASAPRKYSVLSKPAEGDCPPDHFHMPTAPSSNMQTSGVSEGECPPEHMHEKPMGIPSMAFAMSANSHARITHEQLRNGIIMSEILKRPKPGCLPRNR